MSKGYAMWSQFATGSGVVKNWPVSSTAFGEMETEGLIVMERVDTVIRENLAGLGYGE